MFEWHPACSYRDDIEQKLHFDRGTVFGGGGVSKLGQVREVDGPRGTDSTDGTPSVI